MGFCCGCWGERYGYKFHHAVVGVRVLACCATTVIRWRRSYRRAATTADLSAVQPENAAGTSAAAAVVKQRGASFLSANSNGKFVRKPLLRDVCVCVECGVSYNRCGVVL